jgi:hypothetical protein
MAYKHDAEHAEIVFNPSFRVDPSGKVLVPDWELSLKCGCGMAMWSRNQLGRGNFHSPFGFQRRQIFFCPDRLPAVRLTTCDSEI